MTKVLLKGLVRVKAKGRTYWYAWRGGPRITAKVGTPEFAAEFAAHWAAKGGAPPSQESDGDSWDAYDRSAAIGGHAVRLRAMSGTWIRDRKRTFDRPPERLSGRL